MVVYLNLQETRLSSVVNPAIRYKSWLGLICLEADLSVNKRRELHSLTPLLPLEDFL